MKQDISPPFVLYWKEFKCYESLQKTKNAKSVVFEHLRIKCPGQELPLGLAGLTVIIKGNSGICLTEKSGLKLPTVGNLELN